MILRTSRHTIDICNKYTKQWYIPVVSGGDTSYLKNEKMMQRSGQRFFPDTGIILFLRHTLYFFIFNAAIFSTIDHTPICKSRYLGPPRTHSIGSAHTTLSCCLCWITSNFWESDFIAEKKDIWISVSTVHCPSLFIILVA